MYYYVHILPQVCLGLETKLGVLSRALLHGAANLAAMGSVVTKTGHGPSGCEASASSGVQSVRAHSRPGELLSPGCADGDSHRAAQSHSGKEALSVEQLEKKTQFQGHQEARELGDRRHGNSVKTAQNREYP